jgi:hypothetical protein
MAYRAIKKEQRRQADENQLVDGAERQSDNG